MLEFLTESPYPELFLLLGGLCAITIGLLGNNPKTKVDNTAKAIGCIVGAVLIAMGVLMAIDGSWPFSTFIITLLLGIGLFFRVFKKVKVALILALVIGAFVAYGLSLYGVEGVTLAVITLVIIIVFYLLLGFIEFFADFVGGVLAWRPIMLILGILGLIEAALIFSSSSLTTLIGL